MGRPCFRLKHTARTRHCCGKLDVQRAAAFTMGLRMPTRTAKPVESIGLLTQRERECLRLVDQHLSSKQIARELGMSKTSVDTYCDRARRKLGVEDRYAAARIARQLDVGAPLAGAAVNHVLTASGQDTIR